MSKYYQINGLKIRISDHEANAALNGGADIFLYVRSADNQTISVAGQLERICERRGLDINDFTALLNDWQDGSYDKDAFRPAAIEAESTTGFLNHDEQIRQEADSAKTLALSGYKLSSRLNSAAVRAEIQQIHEATGVSKSFIKKFCEKESWHGQQNH